MTWLSIYGSVAVLVLAVLTFYCARSLRGDAVRFAAAVAAAVLWPVMAVGLLQYGAVTVVAAYLSRRSARPMPVNIEPEPATTPMDLVDSLARFAQHVGATRPA